MAADSVLVNAAFKEAATKYGGDVINMKPMYDSNVAGMNKVFNTISGAMGIYSAKKEVGRAGVRKQMAAFQAQANAGVKDMYAQDEPMPDAFINAFRKKITDLQDEFEAVNTYGKGDTAENSMARSRIMGELQRVQNQATNFRAKTNIFLDSIDNVNEGEVNAKDIAGSQQALDFSNYPRLVREGKISKVEYGENGIEITSRGYYSDASGSWGEEVVSLASLKAKFPQTDLEHHAQVFKIRNEYVTQGKAAANKTNPENDYNEEEANEAFTRQVNTPEKFKNVVSSRIDGLSESSFKVNLEKNLQIPLSVLENMYYTEDGSRVEIGQVYKDLNLVDDGVIDEKDIAAGKGNAAFEQNLDSLIDALTNVDNPAFDIGLSASMLGGYLGEIAKSDYKEMFNKTTKENSKNTDGVNKKIGNSLITPDVWSDSYVPYIDFLENPVEGSRTQSPRGLDVIYEDGVFKKEVEGEWVEQSLSDLASIDYIGKYVKGGNTFTSKSAAVIPPQIGGGDEKGVAIAAPRHGGDTSLMLNTDTELVYKGGTTTMVDMFKGSTIDDGDVDDILSAYYPGITITTPFHGTEKIKINGREFKTDTTVAMDNVIAYLNSEEIQRLISKDANNTEFNSNKKVEE